MFWDFFIPTLLQFFHFQTELFWVNFFSLPLTYDLKLGVFCANTNFLRGADKSWKFPCTDFLNKLLSNLWHFPIPVCFKYMLTLDIHLGGLIVIPHGQNEPFLCLFLLKPVP